MSSNGGTIKIFAGESGKPFADRMCAYLGTQCGKADSFRFSEGNTFVRINESIRDKDVYIVQPIGRDPNNEFVELLFWIDAFKRASADSVTAIIPYFGYAKGDKKDEPRVSIRARVCAECIELEGVDRVVTMDLHSPQVQGFFKKPVDHLYGQSLLCEYARRLGIVNDDLVVVSPDAGFAKRARSFADELDKPVAIGDKIRTGHDENAKVMNIIGDVKGRNCLVVDDFSISGGTLLDVTNALIAKGAKDIYVAISHNVINPKGVENILKSKIKLVITTDTVENPLTAPYKDRFKIISAAPMFAQSIKIIHDRAPMSDLFQRDFTQRMLEMSFLEQTSFLDGEGTLPGKCAVCPEDELKP